MNERIEAMIDDAGRDAVFARAIELGWKPGEPVYNFVWEGICAELTQKERSDG